jgi:hypothetical protein
MPSDDDIPDEIAQQAWLMMADGHSLFVQCPGVDAHLGESLYHRLDVSIMVNGGPRIEGLGVELSGPALELLEVRAVDGFSVGGPEFKELGVPFEPRSDGLFAALPGAVLAYNEWLGKGGAVEANEVILQVHGVAKATGQAELIVRLTDLAGHSLDANEVCCEVVILAARRTVR